MENIRSWKRKEGRRLSVRGGRLRFRGGKNLEEQELKGEGIRKREEGYLLRVKHLAGNASCLGTHDPVVWS